MNQIQWTILSIGLIAIGSFLLWMSPSCLSFIGSDLLSACYVRRYSFGIPGMILIPLGIIFSIVSFFAQRH